MKWYIGGETKNNTSLGWARLYVSQESCYDPEKVHALPVCCTRGIVYNRWTQEATICTQFLYVSHLRNSNFSYISNRHFKVVNCLWIIHGSPVGGSPSYQQFMEGWWGVKIKDWNGFLLGGTNTFHCFLPFEKGAGIPAFIYRVIWKVKYFRCAKHALSPWLWKFLLALIRTGHYTVTTSWQKVSKTPFHIAL